MFITVFTTVHHWTLPAWVPSTLCLHILCPWGLFVRPYKLHGSHLFVEGIPSEMLLAFPLSMYRMSHSPPFAPPNNNVWWRSHTDYDASFNIAIKAATAHLHVYSPQSQPPYNSRPKIVSKTANLRIRVFLQWTPCRCVNGSQRFVRS
jgi:hypothetical protein